MDKRASTRKTTRPRDLGSTYSSTWLRQKAKSHMNMSSDNDKRSGRAVYVALAAQSAADELLLTAVREAMLAANTEQVEITVRIGPKEVRWLAGD